MATAFQSRVVEEDPEKAIADLLDRIRRRKVPGVVYLAEGEDGFEIGFLGATLKKPLETMSMIDLMRWDLMEAVRRKFRLIT